MQSIKEKVSNAASSGKARVEFSKAKAEEKAEKARARTEEEKEIAHQLRKAKEAIAKRELHQAKAEHAAEKLRAKQSHLYGPKATGTVYEPVVESQGQRPVGMVDPVSGTTVPTYPLGGVPAPPDDHNEHI